MKNLFANRLKQIRVERNLSLEAMAKITEIPAQTLNRYELGQRTPQITVVSKIADALHISPLWLMGRDELPNKNKGIKIPVLGRVQAGVPIEAIEDIVDYEEIPQEIAQKGEFFGLQIKGNSMQPRILEGDIVIVRKQSTVDNGDIAVVLVNGSDATCKKFYKHNDGINLVSLNPSYAPMFFSFDQVETLPISIIGKVVELRGKF